MKIKSVELFKIFVIILVASLLGYFFGFYLLFAHTAYEIFNYGLMYGAAFLIYYLGSKTYEMIKGDTVTTQPSAKAEQAIVDNAVAQRSAIDKTLDSARKPAAKA